MYIENPKKGIRLTAALLSAALLLGGCGGEKDPASSSNAPDMTTEPTVVYTTPPDGPADTVSCKGTYAVPFDREAQVARVGEAVLTNGELNAFYHLAVNGFQPGEGEPAPDFSIPLDGQMVAGKDMTWQQYFLQQALEAYHSLRALEQKSLEPSQREEEGFVPTERLHKEYMTDMPINEILYTLDNTFKPNTLHQNYLDGIPQMLEDLAEEKGYADAQAMAEAELGEGAKAEDLQQAAWLSNWAYMYYTELSYDQKPTREEVEKALPAGGDQLVDLRHILMIPEGAKKGSDGKVQATKEQWEQGEIQAKDMITTWQKNWERSEFTFAGLAHDHSQDPGTALNGGLFANVRKGQLIEPLDKWCFDAERQPGDMDVIRSDYGYHVVYFCAARSEKFEDTESEIQKANMEVLLDKAMQEYPMEVSYDQITLLPTENQGKLTLSGDLLYPDVAHERITEIPVYIQQDYLGVRFGGGSVSSHGCGITTFAMLSSYMADDYLTPGKMALRFRDRFSGPMGTDGMIFQLAPPQLGYHCLRKVFEWDEAAEALREGRKVVTLQHKGYFTRGGHYLALSEIDDNDMLTIRDSNVYNYRRLEEHAVDSFPAKLVPPAAQGYWIFDYKVVSLPNCSRCGEVSSPYNISREDIPPLLNEEYLCPRCRAALMRRNGFLETLHMQ